MSRGLRVGAAFVAVALLTLSGCGGRVADRLEQPLSPAVAAADGGAVVTGGPAFGPTNVTWTSLEALNLSK